MNRILLFATLAIAVSASTVKREAYSYRLDYVYHAKTDAFYKMHTETESWSRAKELCEDEQASLLPDEPADIVIGHSLMKKYPFIAQRVFVSSEGKIHKIDEDDYTESACDEEDCEESAGSERGGVRSAARGAGSSCNVLTLRGDLSAAPCGAPLPFICKVARADLHYSDDCKLFDTDFKYNATLRSCYKFKGTAVSWGEAFSGCQNEGAHLAVINSAAEAEYLQGLVKGRQVERAQFEWFFHVGFRSHPERGDSTYRTIFNETLEQAGYARWSAGEPNNYASNEHCGSFFRNDGKLNDITCDNLHGYICEKEINA